MITKFKNKNKFISSLILLSLVMITFIAINNTNQVFASNKLTKKEEKLVTQIEKISKKETKKKDIYSVEYIKENNQNKIIINIKLNFYTKNKCYVIANKIIQKSEKRYSKNIDTYQFLFGSKVNEKEVSFEYTRKNLNKVNLGEINTEEFKKIATKVCDHSSLPSYTVEKIGYSWFEGVKEKTIFITTREDITKEEVEKIAEQESLKYIKNNKQKKVVVAFYKSKNSLDEGKPVYLMDYISDIESLKDIKLYREIDQNLSTNTTTTNNKSEYNQNNSSNYNNQNNSNYNYNIDSNHIGKKVYVANGNRYYHCISDCKYLEGAPVQLITLTSSTEKFECNCWTNPVTYKKPSNSNNSSSTNKNNSSVSGRTVYIASGNSYYHKSSSCKFLQGASTTAVSINNVGGKHACNCIKY